MEGKTDFCIGCHMRIAPFDPTRDTLEGHPIHKHCLATLRAKAASEQRPITLTWHGGRCTGAKVD